MQQIQKNVHQYVILGAGLDTFAQRRPEVSSKLQIFEIDKPDTQAWKRRRLIELGYGISSHLHLVPVDFEAGESWQEKLKLDGFQADKPAVIAGTGVSMYLTREANLKNLREITKLAPGTLFAMTFLLPLDLIDDPSERAQHEMVYERARAAGTPFISFFRPSEILTLATEAGFREVKHVSRTDLIQRYFTGREDGLLPGQGEEFLIGIV
jgi:methyltransferase (TIGR00027 family)